MKYSAAIFRVISLVSLSGIVACTTPDAIDEKTLDPNPPTEIGGQRPARVVLPAGYDTGKKYPLVILLHGYGATSELQNVIFGLKQRVDARQFILVLPEGTPDASGKQFWNATPDCCDFTDKSIDDVGYLTALIDESQRLYAVDSGKVSFVGHSNGAYMSYRMACEIPERIHSIGVLAGSVTLDAKFCKGTQPVSVLHMHGTADTIVPYDPFYDDVTDGTLKLQTIGAEATVDRWREKAGCEKAPATTATADLLEDRAGAETDVLTWGGCAAGIAVELWRMNEGDHLVLDVNETFRDRVADFLLNDH